jgi:hypothetical protein
MPPSAQRNVPQGEAPGRRQAASRSANAADRSTSQLGSLASLREIRQSQPDPGRISSGIGDPGGASYGTYQLATNPGTAGTFATSDEVSRYAPQLSRLRPGTREFNDEWRRVATRDPAGFQAVQHAFMERTHYRPAVRGVLQSTGLDLETRGDAVRELTWSIADQLHNHASGIISRAVASTDRRVRRNDVRYDAALIDAINNERAAPHIRLRDELRRQAQRVNPTAARRLLQRAHFQDTLIGQWEEERQRLSRCRAGAERFILGRAGRKAICEHRRGSPSLGDSPNRPRVTWKSVDTARLER